MRRYGRVPENGRFGRYHSGGRHGKRRQGEYSFDAYGKDSGYDVFNGATLEECVETIVQTLPICQTRQVAYATFSILQIFNNGEVYLVEYD